MKLHEHIKFDGKVLDSFLAQGCYRMRQDIFTTNFLWNDGDLYKVFWLRYSLQHFHFGKKPQKLFATNKHFEITIKPFEINKETEALYKMYLDKINFDAPPTINDFLFAEVLEAHHVHFDSEVIELRDNGKLIAVGIFDNGHKSIAGIMNFYDPAYKKYSLGKYLMLLKMQHAIATKKKFYYPGYIAYGYEKFDYKLFPNPNLAEIYDSNKRIWLPYSKELLMQLVDDLDS